MPTFTLAGVTYEYLRPDPDHDREATQSWTYGEYPKVIATRPLTTCSVDVLAVAERWNPSHILVAWADDNYNAHWAWIPAGHVRRITDSERDIEEYRRCPEHLRCIRWGDRLPTCLVPAGATRAGSQDDPCMARR